MNAVVLLQKIYPTIPFHTLPCNVIACSDTARKVDLHHSDKDTKTLPLKLESRHRETFTN